MKTGLQKKPLVSVLMTAYNREKYIGEAITSVLSSSYTDFELIIVDDCSKDNTVEIAKQYEKQDPRIRVYVNESNLGDYHNRNRAASYAQGKYLKYLDSDDLIYPHGLSVFVHAMESFPEAAVGIMSLTNQDEKPYPYLLYPKETYHTHFYLKSVLSTGPSGLIFHAQKFRQSGGFSGQRYIGDTEINLRLASKWPVVITASSLVYWRRHEEQEFTKGMESTGYIELQLPMLEKAFLAEDCPLTDTQKKTILKYYKKIAARGLLNIGLKKKQPVKAWELSRKLKLNNLDFWNAIFFINKKYYE